jgi:formiminoglutamase
MDSVRAELFAVTRRPPESLVVESHDVNDPKMGQFVLRDPRDYGPAEVVLLGCPQDEGVKRNRGRPGARQAPDEIRRALYRFPVPGGVTRKQVFDLGNLRLCRTLEETHERLARVVYQLLRDGRRLIILGGGNDISYPDCRALARAAEDLLVFNIDSHYDVREAERRHSGTPYRQLLEEGFIRPPRFYEVAGKAIVNSPKYEQYLRDKGVQIYHLDVLRENGLDTTIKQILAQEQATAIFWGFDLDAVRAVDAPGVSAGYPVGLTGEEICRLAALAGADKRTRIIELSEVNPQYDIDGRTSKLAAMMILHFLDNPE